MDAKNTLKDKIWLREAMIMSNPSSPHKYIMQPLN